MKGTVLEVFPGLSLLGRAFEEAGFCVVRGPDILWGGDVRRFHVRRGFDGLIGGPPRSSASVPTMWRAFECEPGKAIVGAHYVASCGECDVPPWEECACSARLAA